MLREFNDELIIYCIENDIPYEEYTLHTEDEDGNKTVKYYAIYIFEKDAYTKKKKHPRKYKDLYVPYLRVSHFDEDRPYTRRDGWCEYMDKEDIMNIVDILGGLYQD